jgi:SAM-dependent methyltransferase
VAFLQIAALWFRSRILRSQAARWDYQYAVGKWEKLKGEQSRIAATAAFLRRHAPGGSVLEIGCGEALLQRELGANPYARWIGVDISEIAVARAQAFAGPTVSYVLADMETFDPADQFDAIVFTESIYYSPACAPLLRRYATWLKPNGVFIISIFRTKRSARVWQEIHSVTTQVETGVTSADAGHWDCEVLRPN